MYHLALIPQRHEEARDTIRVERDTLCGVCAALLEELYRHAWTIDDMPELFDTLHTLATRYAADMPDETSANCPQMCGSGYELRLFVV